MDIDEALLDCEERMGKTLADYDQFLKSIRTGQASADVLDGIQVNIPAYGGLVPLKSVAVISRPEARLLVVKPFDPKTMKEIEKGIQASELGITPINDGKVIRLAFPALSEERRTQTVKLLKERLEQHKVALRNIRKDALKHIGENKGKPGVSEDSLKQSEGEVQGLTRRHEGQLDAAFEKKSREVMTI